MKKEAVEALEEVKDLIEELKKRQMSRTDILLFIDYQEKTGQKAQNKVNNVVAVISNYYPLYNPAPGIYKILSKEDLIKYENIHRNHIVENMETYDWR